MKPAIQGIIIGVVLVLASIWGGFYIGSIAPGWAIVPIVLTGVPITVFGLVLIGESIKLL